MLVMPDAVSVGHRRKILYGWGFSRTILPEGADKAA